MPAYNFTHRSGRTKRHRNTSAARRKVKQLARLDSSTLATTTAPLVASKISLANAVAAVYPPEQYLNHTGIPIHGKNSPGKTTFLPTPSTFFPPQTIHLATYLPFSSSSSHHPPPSPLLNPIHPVFRPSNFPTLPPNHYALLTPTLKLASRFLISPSTFAWWLPVLLSHPIPHPNIPNATVLAPVAETLTSSARAALNAHAEDVTFRFRDEVGGFASTHHFHEPVPGGGGGGGGAIRRHKSVVFLDTRFETFITSVPLLLLASSASASASASPSTAEEAAAGARRAAAAQHLRFHFLLAVNLVHELAHTCFLPRPAVPHSHLPHPHPSRSQQQQQQQQQEPHHSPLSPVSMSPELGASWEASVFSGGKIQAVGFDVACRDGLMWFKREEQEQESAGKGGKGRFWGVGMKWVRGWFEEGVWRRREREREQDALGAAVTAAGMERGGMMRVGEGAVREPFFFP